MHHHYKDITDKLGRPMWWDEAGCPRYCAFGPYETNGIYASQVALLEIACQNCGERFMVAMAFTKWRPEDFEDGASLRERIIAGHIHYGDPPNFNCCPAGPTMNCEDLRVVEYWEQVGIQWQRDPLLEIVLPDGADAAGRSDTDGTH